MGSPTPASTLPTDAELDKMQWVADPYADDTIRDILHGVGTGDEHVRRIDELNKILEDWKDNQDVASWVPDPLTPPYIAGPLAQYVKAASLPPPPAWICPPRVERAGAQFMDHGALSVTLLFCASLPECYVVPDLATVLQATGKLVHRVDHRIRATGAMIFPAMMRGGLTSMKGSGIAQILKVRLIHAAIRSLILRRTPRAVQEELATAGAAAPIPPLPGTPITHTQALYNQGWDLKKCALPNNQEELAYTLLTFSYVFLQGMRRLGIPFTQTEEEDYLHGWNVVGHFIGIDESLLVHTMEDAAKLFALMQQRGRDHWTQHPGDKDPRPLLGGALMGAMAKAIPPGVLRPFPILMTRYLIEPASIRDLELDKHVSGVSRALFACIMGAARALDALVRLVSPEFSMCRLITRVIGYQLTCALLMSQVRELLLPGKLQPAVHEVIAGWGDDPKASRWMNALEDRWTTRGSWQKLDPPKS